MYRNINKVADQPKTYSHQIDVFLKDTNPYGSVYFSRIFEWQGICREAWFSKRILTNMFELEGQLVTKRVYYDYHLEASAFQSLICKLNTSNVKMASFDVVFNFFLEETDVLVGKGYQTICYVNNENRISRLPGNIKNKIQAYNKDDIL